MHRARVTAVTGLKAQADGKWLNIIGNKMVVVGDFVWTDGRCIYGHGSAGGEVAPIINNNEPFIPVLIGDGTRAIYHKGQLQKFGTGARHTLMISRGGSFAFADDKSAIDIHLDEVGNRYVLQGGLYIFSDLGDRTLDSWDGEPGIFLNGEMIQPIDLKVYSTYSYDYAWEEVKAARTPLHGVDDEILSVYESYCMLKNGWYESEESYCFLLYCYANGDHTDAINYRGEGEADWGYYVEVGTTMWVLVTPKGAQPLWAGAVRDVAEDWGEERYRYRVYKEKFTIPLPDGYYIEATKELPQGDEPEYGWWVSFHGSLYSPQNSLIYESEFYANEPVRAGHIKRGKWLISQGAMLSLIKDGKKEMLSDYTRNSRLRPMKNYKKWIKGD